MAVSSNFNPRPPRGGRLYHNNLTGVDTEFQSTPPARGATEAFCRCLVAGGISIHAPREGGDTSAWCRRGFLLISIHAPREGGDSDLAAIGHDHYIFQSTPPARGATNAASASASVTPNFNPRPPRGGRRSPCVSPIRAEPFQSTPPRGGRRHDYTAFLNPAAISIHAPARGATSAAWFSSAASCYFNPRPREGGDFSRLTTTFRMIISIHAPARGATASFATKFTASTISIHAPARGATWISLPTGAGAGYFNPRPREGGDDL